MSSQQFYIAVIDLGTGSIRNTVYALSGEVIIHKQKENRLIYPRQGWVEQNPNQWWESLKESFLEMPGEVRENIKAITVTSQREGVVPVDENMKPLTNMIIWLDGRTTNEADEIEKKLGRDAIYDICGLIPNPAWSLAKILWIKKNQHEVYAKTYKFLQAEDYYLSRLSGKPVSEYSIASRTCMLDVKNKQWSRHILDMFDIDQDKLPTLYEPGESIALVKEDIAKSFGLDSDVQVITGAGDQQAAAVGVGALEEGIVSVGIGTSSALSMTITQPRYDKHKNIILNCAAVPGKWEYEPPIWNTGGLIKWFAENIHEDNDYDTILQKTESISAGAGGVLAIPYFSGAGSPRWNPGMKGGFYGITLSHDKYHLLKALMESFAYEIRFNIRHIEQSGIPFKNIILSGGASRNIPLCQIIANVLQTEVKVFEEAEASSKGVFFLACKALEPFRTLKEICSATKAKIKTISPDSQQKMVYDDCYEKYIKLGDVLSHF